MTVPVLFFYAVGLMFFLLAVESLSILYLGLSFFTNLMGYYLSYSSTDYLSTAYLPLVLLMISIVLLFYKVWEYLSPEDWEKFLDKD